MTYSLINDGDSGLSVRTTLNELLSDINEGNLTSDLVPYETIEDAGAFTGWIDGDNINVAYDWTNRTITLTGTNLSFQYKGKKTTLTSPWTSDPHDETTGAWFLSSTDGVNITWSLNTPWVFEDLMVAYVRYNSGGASYSFAIKETHGLMDWESHEEFHSQIGTYRVSGGNVTAGTTAFDVASDEATTPGFDVAVLKDEDVNTSVPLWTQGTYTTMHIGTGSTSVFNISATFPFIAGAGEYINVNNTSTGTLTEGINNRYYNIYQIIMPCASDVDSQKYRMIMLQPQQTFTSLAAALGEDVRSLKLGELATLSPEFIVYTRITYYTGSANANLGKITIPTGGITYNIGNKAGQVSVSGFSANDHTSLSNLTWNASGHIGTNDKVAGFDASGNPTYYDIVYGSSGTSGTSGSSGSSGSSGIDGTSGTSGIDGTSGTSGIDGTSGTSGSSGSSGSSGIDGTSGTSGTSGIDGTSGTSGIDGTSGTSGTSGTTPNDIIVSSGPNTITDIWSGTQIQYDDLSPTYSSSTIYFIE